MKKLLRRDLWKILLCLCILTAAAVLLRPHLTREALALRLPAPLLAHPALLLPVPVLCVLLLWFLLDRFAFRIAAALAWLGVWLSAALLDWKLPRPVIIALLPLLLFAGCELCFRLLRPGRTADFAPLRSWLCLALVLISLLTAVLPTPDEPYGYPVIRAIVSKAEELLHDVRSRIGHRREGDLEFGLSFNGMENAPETGERSAEEGVRLTVQPYLPTAGPLYLFGNAWDRFDGKAWAREDAEDERALLWNADTLEHVYALWRWQQANGETDDERFFRSNSLLIRYGDMETRTLFGNMDALHFFYDEQRYPVTAGAGGIRFDYLQSDGTAYRMYWLEANGRTLEELIAFSEGYVYDPEDHTVWITLMDRYEPRFHLDMGRSTAVEDLLFRKQEQVRARDLGTEGVSARAAALAAEITADCRTDLEKLRAIAAWLQTRYTYTLSPTPVPEGENFLDWLLFETKEGYCTWFATAATLLARSAGVPARFVQGYRTEALETRGNTVIGSETAHAWCEGYIAGYGWVTVEATPGFSAAGDGWLPPEEAQETQPGTDPAVTPAGQTPAAQPDKEKPPVHIPQTEGDQSGEEPGEDPAPRSRLWLLLLLPPAAILLLAAVRAVRHWRRRRHYLQASPEEQVRLDLERLLDYLRRRGHPRAPEDPLRAYFDALPWRFLPAEKEEAMAMAGFYESVLFGGRVPAREQVAAQRDFVERFRPSVRRLPRLPFTSIRTRNFS